MTESPHRAAISRLSADFVAISQQLARVSVDLTELDRLLAERPAEPQPVASGRYPQPYVPPVVPYWPPQYPVQYPAHYSPPRRHVPPPPAPVPPKPRPDRSEG